MTWTDYLTTWWIDFFAAATVLLAAMLVAGRLVREPVRSMTIAWSGVIAMLVMMVCSAAPVWPRLALLTLSETEPAEGSRSIAMASKLPLAELDTLRQTEAQPSTNENPHSTTYDRLPKADSTSVAIPLHSRGNKTDVTIDTLSMVRGLLLTGALIMSIWLVGGQIRAWRLCRRASDAPE